jgi:hypothetical protein
MTMKFKYFKITENTALDDIELALKSSEARDSATKILAEKLGAYNCLQYTEGSIAAFKFISTPDKAVWKRVKHGFLPKVKTDEYKMLADLPKQIDYREIIKRYGFGGEMLIGEHVEGRGFKMHSSYIKGNRKSGFYAIVAPYDEKFDREVHNSLLELKEWEVLKAIEEASDAA